MARIFLAKASIDCQYHQYTQDRLKVFGLITKNPKFPLS